MLSQQRQESGTFLTSAHSRGRFASLWNRPAASLSICLSRDECCKLLGCKVRLRNRAIISPGHISKVPLYALQTHPDCAFFASVCLSPLKLICCILGHFLNFNFMLLMLFWGVFQLHHHSYLSFWMVVNASSTLPLLWQGIGLYQRSSSSDLYCIEFPLTCGCY